MSSSNSHLPHRVALVTGCVALGGSTTFLVNLAGELVRRGIPVEVLSFERENPMGADFQRQHIPLSCLDQHRMIFEDRLQRILQQLARFAPTVVAATLGPVSFEVLRYLPKGVFRIGMGQSDDPQVYQMMRQYTPWMDLAVMVSQVMKHKAEALPEFAKVPVVSLPYGVPMFTDAELPVRSTVNPLRILYLGRLDQEQKRVRLFPEILAQLSAAGMPFDWTIAGAGPEREFLEKTLKPAGPGQTVSFAGPVPYDQVPNLLQEQDVFLLASDYEGLPLSLLEAMGRGLVPVVSDLKSGIPEVVDSSNGMLVPIHDVAGYSRAIIHLHEHRDELAAKSAAARARVKTDFSVAAMTDRWLGSFSHPAGAIKWPNEWRITAPLPAQYSIRFTPPLRTLRRLAARLRPGNGS